MKRLIATIVLTTGLAAGPAMADHPGNNILSKENVGGAIGAAIGGFAGSKIVKGKGRPAVTAAGAVGGFLLGQNVARNYGGAAPQPARHGGYRNRGHGGHKSGHRKHGRSSGKLIRMNETRIARTTSNVRAGPGTGYAITGRLHAREPVRVTGRLQHRNWYAVEDRGRRGYVYAPLLVSSLQGYRSGHRSDRYQRNDGRRGWHR